MSTASNPDVLVIAASNGENLKLAQRFVDEAKAQGKSADLLDLTTLDLPLFTPRVKDQGIPDGVRPLHEQLMGAPRWVICAPEYN
ncbi:NADPH-dependent oxidoreductase, partial [Escherichia coli]|nr:NADPH-dependent oxidoreductase [Escherichia coli]